MTGSNIGWLIANDSTPPIDTMKDPFGFIPDGISVRVVRFDVDPKFRDAVGVVADHLLSVHEALEEIGDAISPEAQAALLGALQRILLARELRKL